MKIIADMKVENARLRAQRDINHALPVDDLKFGSGASNISSVDTPSESSRSRLSVSQRSAPVLAHPLAQEMADTVHRRASYVPKRPPLNAKHRLDIVDHNGDKEDRKRRRAMLSLLYTTEGMTTSHLPAPAPITTTTNVSAPRSRREIKEVEKECANGMLTHSVMSDIVAAQQKVPWDRPIASIQRPYDVGAPIRPQLLDANPLPCIPCDVRPVIEVARAAVVPSSPPRRRTPVMQDLPPVTPLQSGAADIPLRSTPLYGEDAMKVSVLPHPLNESALKQARYSTPTTVTDSIPSPPHETSPQRYDHPVQSNSTPVRHELASRRLAPHNPAAAVGTSPSRERLPPVTPSLDEPDVAALLKWTQQLDMRDSWGRLPP